MGVWGVLFLGDCRHGSCGCRDLLGFVRGSRGGLRFSRCRPRQPHIP